VLPNVTIGSRMSSDVVYDSSFFKVRRNPSGWYFYGERKGIDSVAFILLKKGDKDSYCLVNERKPPLDEFTGDEAFLTTAFGGSQDKIDRNTYLGMPEKEKLSLMTSIAHSECSEEGGFLVDDSRTIFLGKVLLSTQMNQYVYCFVFDVTGLKFSGTNPQDKGEEKATLVWMTENEVADSECIKARAILLSLKKSTRETRTSARVPVPEEASIVDYLTKTRIVSVSTNVSENEVTSWIRSYLQSLGYEESDDVDVIPDLVVLHGNYDDIPDNGVLINADEKDTRIIRRLILSQEIALIMKE
jgi:hypothetical protein